jgi:hypothetical protein
LREARDTVERRLERRMAAEQNDTALAAPSLDGVRVNGSGHVAQAVRESSRVPVHRSPLGRRRRQGSGRRSIGRYAHALGNTQTSAGFSRIYKEFARDERRIRRSMLQRRSEQRRRVLPRSQEDHDASPSASIIEHRDAHGSALTPGACATCRSAVTSTQCFVRKLFTRLACALA